MQDDFDSALAAPRADKRTKTVVARLVDRAKSWLWKIDEGPDTNEFVGMVNVQR